MIVRRGGGELTSVTVVRKGTIEGDLPVRRVGWSISGRETYSGEESGNGYECQEVGINSPCESRGRKKTLLSGKWDSST